MEDDDEIQSHPSPDSGSPSSPCPNGRITVTVASAPPHQSNIALALPIQQHQPPQQQQQSTRPSGNGGGREDCWSEGATSVLIDAWGERYMELSRGNLKQKHWKEVADIVSSREDYTKPPKTDIQCKNRIDTVKKKYKSEKSKIAVGMGPSKWSFYDRLERLIGPTTSKISSGAGTSTSTPATHRVPMGIPVGVRSVNQYQNQPRQKPKQNLRRRPPVNSDTESSRSEPEPPSPDSTDSFPPATYVPKRAKFQHHNQRIANPIRPVMNQNMGMGTSKGEDKGNNNSSWGNSVRDLTRAILKFGEAYEQAESSKLQQLVDMEKQRMKFTKELEIQRMQFFMKTQVELSQLKNRRVGGNNSHHNNNSNNNMNNNHNNSDSSS